MGEGHFKVQENIGMSNEIAFCIIYGIDRLTKPFIQRVMWWVGTQNPNLDDNDITTKRVLCLLTGAGLMIKSETTGSVLVNTPS